MISPSPEDCIALGAALPPIVIVCMGFRLYSVIKCQRIRTDDYFAVLAFAVYLTMSIILIIGSVKYGFGRHVDGEVLAGFNEDTSEVTTNTKHMDFICELLLPWGLGAAKLSILFFYRCIFRGRAFHIVSWLLIVYCASWSITFFCLDIFQCGRHVSSLWSSEKAISVSCLPGTPLGYWNAILDFIPDIAILAVPIYWTTTLQLTPGRRIFVLFVFLFGGLAVVASLARTVIFIMVYRVHNTDPDQLAFLTNKTYFEILELGVALIAISLPKLTSLLSEKRKRAIAHRLNWLVPSSLHRTARADSLGTLYPMTNKSADPSNSANSNGAMRGQDGVAADCFANGVGLKADEDEESGNIMVVTEFVQDVTLAPIRAPTHHG